ncbi:hypothetical protein RFI_33009 [Reticulomyxa filosa]|uniref:TRAF-type domain-containing protein n=1 Tax=Reticulomyxa filosa TaxID=46433 RepID=X6LRB2_RETFI|nr:hypothetical protein RFI_33009 [Reticulomyxa filosa]|eukprot:ETO04388.1 hypothetical protein RFI_33009 [Reticulomyxa filosa]
MNDNLILGAEEKERSISLECLLCAGNAMELTYNFHVKQENPLIIGENCLIRYLESNNNRCPKDNHINCDYTIAKLARTLINNLTIGCPGKSIIQLNQMANNVNVSSICCGFKGKISAIKKYLEESCTFKLMECEFKKYGCVDIVTRFNYKEYYKLEIDKHLELIKNYIVKLETKEWPLDEKKCANDQKGNCNFKLSKNTKEKIGELHGHSNNVTCVKFSPYHRLRIVVLSFVLHHWTKPFVFGICVDFSPLKNYTSAERLVVIHIKFALVQKTRT